MTSQFLEACHLRLSLPDGFSESCFSAGFRISSADVKRCFSARHSLWCLALPAVSHRCSGYLWQPDLWLVSY